MSVTCPSCGADVEVLDNTNPPSGEAFGVCRICGCRVLCAYDTGTIHVVHPFEDDLWLEEETYP